MTNAQIIDGKAIAEAITDGLIARTQKFVKATGRLPCLAVVLVGSDPASSVYVRNKGRTAEKIGYRSIQESMPEDTSESDLVALIERLNGDHLIDGILVQLPLPRHINSETIIDLIDPNKDVDGFHPINVGYLGAGNLTRALVPCTPAGCITLAKAALGDDLSGQHVVIVGRSNIVGKPAAQLFLNENCTVTIAHSRTRDLPSLVRQADIVVGAVGRPEMIKGDWVKPGATVIDVGINRIDAPQKGEGKTKLVGDVDFASAIAVAAHITPVPGGVGPMTIAMLMENTFTAACRRTGQINLLVNK